MANFESIAEKAAQYVLGELPPEERAEFEALLDQSAELRAHVQELEEGALLIAIGSTRVAPPKGAFREINRVIAHDEQQRKLRVIVGAIFKNGWAAAAACLVGWLLYALVTDHGRSNRFRQPSLAGASSQLEAQTASATNIATIGDSNLLSSQPPAATERQLEIANREAVLLRNQLAGLQQQMAQLSSALTQQQVALNEPSRMKFLQLAPTGGVDKTVLSPAVQRALFYALANELGWLSFTNENRFSAPPIPDDFGLTNGVNMDFVDLRTNNSAPIRLRAPAPKQLAQNGDGSNAKDGSNTSDTQPTSSTVIPGFISGTTLFFAVDSTMASPGSQFVVSPAGLGEESSTIMLNDAPVVVAAHLLGGAFEGTPWTVTFLGKEGSSNVVFSFVRAPQSP